MNIVKGQQIIDKRLKKSGWDVKDPSQVTEELDIVVSKKKAADPSEKYAGHQFADYALLGKDGLSPRELAHHITDNKGFLISKSSVYKILS